MKKLRRLLPATLLLFTLFGVSVAAGWATQPGSPFRATGPAAGSSATVTPAMAENPTSLSGAQMNGTPVAWQNPDAGCGLIFPPLMTDLRETVLTGVAALAPDNVWAVGYARTDGRARTVILHGDGTHWQDMPAPNLGHGINVLYSIAAIAPDNIWAVGTTGEMALATLVVHWDGHRWQVVPSPNQGPTNNILRSVAATAADDIWAVGSVNTGVAQFEDLMLHWDGTAWHLVETPHRAAGFNLLNGVGARARDDAWAVGRGNTGMQILHWNGRRWADSMVPEWPLLTELYAVAARGARDAWAVGSDGLTLHWDGQNWHPVPSPSPGGSKGALRGLALAPAGPWAVGDTTGDLPWIVQGGKANWELATLPAGLPHAFLRAVAVAPDGAIWTVGADHTPTGAAPVGSLEAPGTGAALISRQTPACNGSTPRPHAAPRGQVIADTALTALTAGGALLWRDIQPNKSLHSYDPRTRQAQLLAGPGDYGHLASDGQWVVWADTTTIQGLELRTQRTQLLLTVPAPQQIGLSGIAVAGSVLYYTNNFADSAAPGEVPPTPPPDQDSLLAYNWQTGQTRQIALRGFAPVVGDGVLLWTEAGLHLRYLDGQGPDQVLDQAEADPTGAGTDYQYAVSGRYVVWARRPGGGAASQIHLYDLRNASDRVLATGTVQDPQIRGDWVVWTVAPSDPYTRDLHSRWTIMGYRISSGQTVPLVTNQGGPPLTAVGLVEPNTLAYRQGELYAELYLLPLP